MGQQGSFGTIKSKHRHCLPRISGLTTTVPTVRNFLSLSATDTGAAHIPGIGRLSRASLEFRQMSGAEFRYNLPTVLVRFR